MRLPIPPLLQTDASITLRFLQPLFFVRQYVTFQENCPCRCFLEWNPFLFNELIDVLPGYLKVFSDIEPAHHFWRFLLHVLLFCFRSAFNNSCLQDYLMIR